MRIGTPFRGTGDLGVRTRIPPAIWALGFVSLLMDISSELIHSLLPVFLVTSLGASALMVGLIEGVAEATALIVKVFSGALSDYWGKRKPLAVLGYGLGALSKPLFALATSSGLVLGARLMDRVGKGIRGAPRDALVADIAPPELRGAAFGLRQSLDTVGAFLGPLLAMGLMVLWANDFRAVFWVAIIPAFLAVALLLFGVQEPEKTGRQTMINPVRRENLRRLSSGYLVGRNHWGRVHARAILGSIPDSPCGAGRTADRIHSFGLDRHERHLRALGLSLRQALGPNESAKLLALGLAVLIGADIVLAYSNHWTWVWAGITLWGLHMGITQGLLATMVADTAPADLRGTAYGFFNLVSGLAMLVASVLAGLLWDWFGASFTFIAGAVFSTLALAVILFARSDAASRS